MRRTKFIVVIIALSMLWASGRIFAEREGSGATKKRGFESSSKASAGFAGGDSSSSGDENNPSLTANKHRTRTRINPREGRRRAGDRRIQERA